MKNFLQKLFYIPKYGKVSETALVSRLATYIFTILLCMAGMAFTAYAFFSASVLSGNNVIQAAYFDVEIAIEEVPAGRQTGEQAVSVPVSRDGANLYHAFLEAGKVYSVTVRAIGTAETGFMVVSAGSTRYYSQQMFRDSQPVLAFRLAPAENMDVSFMPHFGTSSHYENYKNGIENPFYITENTQVPLALQAEPPATEPPATEPPATELSTTEPPTTEPPTTEPPTTEPPTTEPPTTEPPTTEPPTTEPEA